MFVMRITTDFEIDADGGVVARYSGIEPHRRAILITYRNVESLPGWRVDAFPTAAAAIAYVKENEPACPRLSLGGRSPDPTPSWQEHLDWLHERGLRSAAEGDCPKPDWARNNPTAFESFQLGLGSLARA
jgi:hypothetical protein